LNRNSIHWPVLSFTILSISPRPAKNWNGRLENAGNLGLELAAGDAVLLSRHAEDAPPVVIGRIGRYGRPAARVTLEAGQTLSLKCGDASVDLRADGKVMVRGDDVLVHAKGTNRIRAGSVAIN
jgi:hypothetical protein